MRSCFEDFWISYSTRQPCIYTYIYIYIYIYTQSRITGAGRYIMRSSYRDVAYHCSGKQRNSITGWQLNSLSRPRFSCGRRSESFVPPTLSSPPLSACQRRCPEGMEGPAPHHSAISVKCFSAFKCEPWPPPSRSAPPRSVTNCAFPPPLPHSFFLLTLAPCFAPRLLRRE